MEGKKEYRLQQHGRLEAIEEWIREMSKMGWTVHTFSTAPDGIDLMITVLMERDALPVVPEPEVSQ